MGYDHAELKELKEDEIVPSSSSESSNSWRNGIKLEKQPTENEIQRSNTIETVSDAEAEAVEAVNSKEPHKHHLHMVKLKFRADNDTDPADWWFASTAIPLIAATFAPMANVLSICALVVYWRNNVVDPGNSLYQATSVGYKDPHW
jgi:hypothetical protein